MTAIRHALQKDIFEPDEERLLNLIHVTDALKKKKTSFLCLTITTHHPVIVRLHEIRKSEKGDFYKKKRFWLLRDLKVIDGKNPRKVVPEFELTSDRHYAWTVTNPSEKDPFIKQLWKLCNRFIPAQKPEFVNVPLLSEELEYALTSTNASINGSVGHHEEEIEEYQPISSKEEEDFRTLLNKCHMTLGQAERFADHLTRELSVLDSANIQAIMGSEVHIAELMNKIDLALEEASVLEDVLDSYDELLLHVREGVEMMEEKDTLIHMHATNRKRLFDELHQFINLMDFSMDDYKILNECNLSDPTKINRCTQATISLQKCMKAKIGPGYEKLKAYNDQMKFFVQIRDRFAERLVAHLTALFRNLAAEALHAQGITLPRHDNTIHIPLKPFSDLNLWLKQSVPDGYRMLLERYVACCKDMYRREMTNFFDLAKQQVRSGQFERKPSMMKASASSEFGRMVKSPSNLTSETGRQETSGDSPLSNVDRQQFQSVVETILKEIEPVVHGEQKFCTWFFHISSEIMSAVETNSPSSNFFKIGSNESGQGVTPERKLERQYNEQVRNVMSQLFDNLDLQLLEFVAYCDRANQFYNIHLLALLSNRALANQDPGAYISTVLGKIVVLSKRRFDVFMETQVHHLCEAKLSKRMRIGLLPNLHHFEELAKEAELAFQNCQRRGDLDRWYPQVVLALCQGIENVSQDPNSKSPPAVVQMENYHRLFSILSQLKIVSLDQAKKDAKLKYQSSLAAYVKEYMGKPMEKLQGLLDQIEACIETGMKPEAIGYQQAFSKQELRKAISAYPGKEVKKGLEQLYKKVEKHLCDEENLLQVVWRNMQDEFIQQYKHHEQLISQCYPNSNIQMEFSIQDLLLYFSDIAQQH